MADQEADPWPIEPIPKHASLFMRVHRSKITEDGDPEPGVFRNLPNPKKTEAPWAMSTDWEKYSTPLDTRNRAESSEPKDNGVISLVVAKIEAIAFQRVEHSPRRRDPENPKSQDNRAHTDVFGPKSVKEGKTADERAIIQEVRFRYLEIFKWEMMPESA